MPEVVSTIALLSAFLLLASVLIWAKRLRGPLLQRLDGQRASNIGPAEVAIKALFLAFGLSVVAASLTIAGWIFL
jgi:hypothetical protein